MSLYGAMFSGVSGLNAQSQALGIISDNISNMNTVGYKTNKASFSTLVTGQTKNSYAPGGVRSIPLANVAKQGLLQASSNPTDLAITGKGFFTLADSATPTSSATRFYTRACEFTADASGYLRSPSGFFLQGWATDLAGVPTASNPSLLSSLETVRVTSISGSAGATKTLEIGLNLPATKSVGGTETTTIAVFDSLGVEHTASLKWTKTGTNAWTLDITVADASTVDETTVGSNAGYSVAVIFNSDGTPNTFDGASTPPALALGSWNSGAADSIITMDLGTQATADGVTQFSGDYSVAFVNQDGVQFGNFFGVKIDDKGIVTARFDNGETRRIYKIPVATFPNPNGLDTKTGTVYAESDTSGNFFLRNAREGIAGRIISSTLEASTSDIAGEFTNLIITQRAYAASTRIITTADEMLDELIRIKR